jgi:Thermophilic metalloprotease (M29)
MMSPGVILPGSWGNIPPGETFCCPDPTTVNGAICINGSVPDHVMMDGEETVLHFEQGKLTRWEGDPGSRSYRFFGDQQRKSDAERDKNWNTFAELGLGLNPAISALTGNSLFDEKAAKTVHIAIGDNHVFGHHVESNLHADLVTWRASLRLDGVLVMDHGELLEEGILRERNSRYLVYPNIPEDVSFFLIGSKVATQRHGEFEILVRRLFKQFRVGHVAMAKPEIGRLLARLATKLATYNQVKMNEFLSEYEEFDNVSSRDLLNMLHHYRVLGTTRL